MRLSLLMRVRREDGSHMRAILRQASKPCSSPGVVWTLTKASRVHTCISISNSFVFAASTGSHCVAIKSAGLTGPLRRDAQINA